MWVLLVCWVCGCLYAGCEGAGSFAGARCSLASYNTLYSQTFLSRGQEKEEPMTFLLPIKATLWDPFQHWSFQWRKRPRLQQQSAENENGHDVDVAVEKDRSVLQTDGHVNDPDTQSFLKKLRNTWTIYLVICTYIYSHIYKSKDSARSSVPCYLSQLKWTVAVAPVFFPPIKVHVALGCSWLFVEF